jgi:hypothetical protein
METDSCWIIGEAEWSFVTDFGKTAVWESVDKGR